MDMIQEFHKRFIQFQEQVDIFNSNYSTLTQKEIEEKISYFDAQKESLRNDIRAYAKSQGLKTKDVSMMVQTYNMKLIDLVERYPLVKKYPTKYKINVYCKDGKTELKQCFIEKWDTCWNYITKAFGDCKVISFHERESGDKSRIIVDIVIDYEFKGDRYNIYEKDMYEDYLTAIIYSDSKNNALNKFLEYNLIDNDDEMFYVIKCKGEERWKEEGYNSYKDFINDYYPVGHYNHID